MFPKTASANHRQGPASQLEKPTCPFLLASATADSGELCLPRNAQPAIPFDEGGANKVGAKFVNDRQCHACLQGMGFKYSSSVADLMVLERMFWALMRT